MLASHGPPVTLSSVKSLSWVAKEASKVCLEIATPPPNGEPPFGSSKIPSTLSRSVAPVGVFSETASRA